MTLIKCPECGRDVSDRAAACPECAYPVAPQEPKPPPVTPVVSAQGRAVTGEATGKRWKAMQAIGAAMMLGGIALALVLVARGSDAPALILLALTMGVLLIGGLIVGIVGRVGAWWYHA